MIARSRQFYTKALQMLATETRGLQKAAYVLAFFSFGSGLLGLLRDHIFAHIFGAGEVLDVYYAAFRVADYLFVFMGALVSVYILIPELSGRTEKEQHQYIDTVVAGFSLLAFILCGLAALFAPFFLGLFFKTFAARGLLPELTLATRIILLQPILLSFSNILAAIVQLRHRYFLYAVSPLFYNIGIILGALLLYPHFGIGGLAAGVVLGALLQVLIQLPSVVADGFFHRLPLLSQPRVLFDTFRRSAPRALALSMNELAENGLIYLAGLLAIGSITRFTFAYNLQTLLVSVIGASYSIAVFPLLAAALQKGDQVRFIEYVATVARYVVFWSLPATALMIVLRAYIVRVILGSGQFNWTDTRLTAAAFGLFAVSLAAQGVMLLIIRAYYAAGRSFVPFFVSTLMAVTIIVFGAASVGALHALPVVAQVTKAILRVVGVPGTTVLALAFAYTVANILGTIVLIVHFEYRFSGFFRRVALSWLQSLGATLAAGLMAYLTLAAMGPITLSSTVLTIFLHGFAAGIVGIAAGALTYAAQGSREFIETWETLRHRIPNVGTQARTLAPDIVAASEEHTSL